MDQMLLKILTKSIHLQPSHFIDISCLFLIISYKQPCVHAQLQR